MNMRFIADENLKTRNKWVRTGLHSDLKKVNLRKKGTLTIKMHF